MFKAGVVIRDWRILFVLTPGAGGNVAVVEDLKTQEKLVLKASFVEEPKRVEFEEVISVWKTLSNSCENVVKFKKSFYEETNAVLLMEYCEGGDLGKLIKRKKEEGEKFTEYEIRKIACDTLNGLNALHSKGIIHRDLKPNNILITENWIYKIADFNLSRELNAAGQSSITAGGTLIYMAPEIFNMKSASFSSDLYALGALLYEVIALKPTFSEMDIPSILANRYSKLNPAMGYSAALIDLIHSLLALDPAARPSITDAQSRLQASLHVLHNASGGNSRDNPSPSETNPVIVDVGNSEKDNNNSCSDPSSSASALVAFQRDYEEVIEEEVEEEVKKKKKEEEVKKKKEEEKVKRKKEEEEEEEKEEEEEVKKKKEEKDVKKRKEEMKKIKEEKVKKKKEEEEVKNRKEEEEMKKKKEEEDVKKKKKEEVKRKKEVEEMKKKKKKEEEEEDDDPTLPSGEYPAVGLGDGRGCCSCQKWCSVNCGNCIHSCGSCCSDCADGCCGCISSCGNCMGSCGVKCGECCVGCVNGCMNSIRFSSGVAVMGWSFVFLGLTGLIMAIVMFAGLKSLYNAMAGLMLMIALIYMLSGLAVIYVSCNEVINHRWVAQCTFATAIVLFGLTIVVAFMNHAGYTYADSVFQMNFEKYADDKKFPALETRSDLQKVMGRHSPMISMSWVFFAFALCAGGGAYAVVFVNSATETEMETETKTYKINLWNALMVLPTLYCSCGYGISIALGMIYARTSHAAYSEVFGSFATLCIILSTVISMFLVIYNVALLCACHRLHLSGFIGFIIPFCILSIVCLVLGVALPLSFIKSPSSPCMDDNYFHVCIGSPNRSSSFLSYYIHWEDVVEVDQTLSLLPRLDMSTLSSFDPPSVPVHAHVPVSGMFSSLSSTSASPSPTPPLSSPSPSLPFLSFRLSNQEYLPPENQDFCAAVGRSVLRYNLLVNSSALVLLRNNTGILCYNVTEAAMDVLWKVQEGVTKLGNTAIWLGIWAVIPFVAIVALIAAIMIIGIPCGI